MLAKLKDSCLTARDAAVLRLQPFTAQQVQAKLTELTFKRAGFRIPYFDLNGKISCFYRVRYLEYDNGRGFARLTHKDGRAHKYDIRYVQPPDTVPQLYLPPTVPWAKLSKAKDIPLTITEGELKAACGCKHDIPALGLGGVWAWRSAKKGIHLLPIFKEFDWSQRPTYICFDSDASQNPDVCSAEQRLAHELTDLGAAVHICRIPELEGKKTGLDDYIAAMGAAAFKQDVHANAELYTACEELFKLNAEVVYIRDPGVILCRQTLQRMTPRNFMEHAYANRVWLETVQSGQTQKIVERSAPREWIKWPHRATVQYQTYWPGAPRVLTDGGYNTWTGWGCQPSKGDTRLWHRLLEHLWKDTDNPVWEKQWFLQWLAYPIQHPGVKLRQSVMIWSQQQQVGKSLVGYIMGRIYSKNFTEIGTKELSGSFNEWAANRQFVMGDEISSSSERKRNAADRLKSTITQIELRINAKYVPSYAVPDCVNYYFTSNHPDALYLEDKDARFYVVAMKRPPLPKEFYQQCAQWALHGGGASAIMYELLHLPITSYDPDGHAPNTSGKQDMSEAAKNDLEAFVHKLRTEPDTVMNIGDVATPRDLWTLEQLTQCAEHHGYGILSRNALAAALQQAGFDRCRGSSIRGVGPRDKNGERGTARLWMIRDVDKLKRMTVEQLRDHYLHEWRLQDPKY
jgi:hypothetical protein